MIQKSFPHIHPVTYISETIHTFCWVPLKAVEEVSLITNLTANKSVTLACSELFMPVEEVLLFCTDETIEASFYHESDC